ncbi:MAG TPA: hypothetical protein VLT81_11850, partial [Chondromyces sp.]|nr:hypothetical protein [Chondromyces sp.]
MDAGSGEDLGHGVRVIPGSAEELVVLSPHLDLGWRVAAGRTPGMAVLWGGRAFEVVAHGAVRSGSRWTLRPWPDAVAMRAVLRLDAAAVADLAAQAAAVRRRRRGRVWSIVLLPLAGLAPARMQERWSQEWGLSSEAATWTSALAEVVLGGFALVQGLALVFGGGWFLPEWLRWSVVAGPVLCLEGLFRLVLAGALQGPVGSILGLPLRLLEAEPEAPAPADAPEVRLLDEDAGVLELVTPAYRPDWHGDGVLPFRGRAYRLERTDREGRAWVYRFVGGGGAVPGETELLRLRPLPSAPKPGPAVAAVEEPPSIFRTALVTAAVTLGPRADQERWAAHIRLRPVWLTVAGGGAEL